MDHEEEAESSHAGQRRGNSSLGDADTDTEQGVDGNLVDVMDTVMDEEEEMRDRERLVKERRVDARRKRIRLLNDLLRDLDMVVYMELITLYYFEYVCMPNLAPSRPAPCSSMD